MPGQHTELTAWALWQKCWQGSGRQEQKSFWSDIVLFMKNYPGKTAYFSELLKKSGVKGYAGQPLTAPLPVLVKKLLKQAETFTPDDWQEVINAWNNIKPELKIKIQSALLRQESLVKKFMSAVLTDCQNSKELLDETVRESGLLPQCQKNDIILTLCIIVAESLAGQTNEKESDIMSENTAVNKAELPEGRGLDDAAEATLHAGAAGGQAADILQGCLLALRSADPLLSEWSDLELFLQEIKQTIEKKGKEKEETMARNKLLGEFTGKWDYLSDVFFHQLNALVVKLPARASANDMSNARLSGCIDVLGRLQAILPRYKEITEKKPGNISEEKNRIAALLAVVTEIETAAQLLPDFIVPAEDDARAAVFVQQTEESAGGENIPQPPEAANGGPAEKSQDDEAQMELFVDK